jgi:preprotein translocase subunit SecA
MAQLSEAAGAAVNPGPTGGRRHVSFPVSAPSTHVFHPEREAPRYGTLERLANTFFGRVAGPVRVGRVRRADIAGMVNACSGDLAGMSSDGLREEAARLRLSLMRNGFQTASVARSFALIREAADRTVGLRHFDCQLAGGWVLLNGMVAEMETGEGKTLTATLAAGTAALGGVPVHVITVNDYLAGRDAEWMGPVYRALGLTVGCIIHDVAPPDRRGAYACDVVYCTNKEIVFDYLRDRLALKDRVQALRLQAESIHSTRARTQRLVLRGLHYAIVDEADSVLIDEARTPLIISGGGRAEQRAFLEQALELARGLTSPEDYRLDQTDRKVTLTESGKARLEAVAPPLGALWRGSLRREETVRRALSALHFFHRDEHYLVRDDRVEIIDEFTGRVMPDRSWERGLHQLIEVKEGCTVSLQHETLARISYQRFFRRYLKLAGMTGTAREASGELLSVYGLHVVSVPTNRPVRRAALPDRIHPDLDSKWNAVVTRIAQLHGEGRPVLVGTRSVAASEQLSTLLTDNGLPHQVLNAKFDREEAEIVAGAGQTGRITIATNMAGRGTDIKLGEGVVERGGLHVMLTERHEAGRIDRQLSGRCGRQGDPGSHEAFLSLEDPLLEMGNVRWRRSLARRALRTGLPAWRGAALRALRGAQRKLERVHAGIRRDLLKQDEHRGTWLSFTGQAE